MMPYGSLDVIGVDGPTIAHLFLPHPPLAAQRVCGEPPPRRQSVTISLWRRMSAGRSWGVEANTRYRLCNVAYSSGTTRTSTRVPCTSIRATLTGARNRRGPALPGFT
jgi:hypothetical protein